MKILVENIRHYPEILSVGLQRKAWLFKQDDDLIVYVGRPSPLGNPYKVSKEIPREKAIALYRSYLWDEINSGGEYSQTKCAIYRVLELVQTTGVQCVRLLCYCAPSKCHGDVVANCISWLLTTTNIGK